MKNLLFLLLLIPMIGKAQFPGQTIVIPGGVTTVLPPGEYNNIDVRKGAKLIFADGEYKVWNIMFNETDVVVDVKQTSKVMFMSLHFNGKIEFNNYSESTEVANEIEIQNNNNTLNLYAKLITDNIQLSDNSIININSCSGQLIVKNTFNIRGQGKINFINGGRIIVHKQLSIDSDNIFTGYGMITAQDANIMLNSRLTESDKIRICGTIRSEQIKNLGKAKQSCETICDPLPVTFKSFDGIRLPNNDILIDLTVVDADGSDSYEYQLSGDAVNFVTVKTVAVDQIKLNVINKQLLELNLNSTKK